ncbi:GntR family transcriptional regulator [Metabacillus sp. GX 13764]|uniref:FadR/GntR family transcriptional regulator n=1 Tax=Metabacillus kandeliae TaxID=2900151 RepID=UPI001E3523DD|nr:GntR family transcriptional regulator [Metabacillus kandeliae]MCD7032791.1 GntR family transcriptional regulator [Metabacillus kandeliae]
MNNPSLTPSQAKVYEENIRRIREIIKEDGLAAGDKLPSERELADRLQVGRSSVREALRALELLGFIETKRGEGTFIKDFAEHHLIKLLGTFILEDPKAESDLIELHEMIEKNALSMAMNKKNEPSLLQLQKNLLEETCTCEETLQSLIRLSGNYLLYRIWAVIRNYAGAVSAYPEYSKEACSKLISSLLSGNDKDFLAAYEGLKDKRMSNNK